jgi:membrane protease YdiL (CAAX protease family)
MADHPPCSTLILKGFLATERRSDLMTPIKDFVKSHPLLSFFVLAFVISWAGVIMVVGPSGIAANRLPSDMQIALLYPTLVVGPSVAGLLLTGLLYGKEGFRELRSRLLKWRVGARWYAVALLTAPLSYAATSLVLWLSYPKFVPAIFTADGMVALLLMGIFAGLFVALFEELGWTGFAIPRMRLRYSILGTGLIVGLLWGAWHFLVFFVGVSNPATNPSAGAIPLVLFLPILIFTFLPVYRVLMVWVYDRTESLLLAILMHASVIVSQTNLTSVALTTGMPVVISNLVVTAVLWVVVAVIALAQGGHLTRQPPLRGRAA